MKLHLILVLCLTLLAACTLQPDPATSPGEDARASLVLSASAEEGPAPLEVAFSAEVAPATAAREGAVYTWTEATRTLSGTTAELTHTFDEPGVYVVTATTETRLGPASGSISVSVTRADTPPENPGEPTEGTLEVTQTPGGPAPWAVRYTIQVEGYSETQVRVRCAGEGGAEVSGADATCIHTTSGEQVHVSVVADGEVIDSLSVDSGVSAPESGVAFLGTWRYTSRGAAQTFDIVEGSTTKGRSADGAFELFVIELEGRAVAEFTFGGRTVVLEPVPEDDGRQVFYADVYDLQLERLEE